jgi:hypothetical protein
MQFHTIVSAFYLDRATTFPDLATLVHYAGMRDVRPLRDTDRIALGFFEPEREILGGTWGVFQETWAVLDEVEGLVCVQLYSPYTRFLDARLNEREKGPEGNEPTSMTYVKTFADACLRLNPLVVLLDTRAHYEIKQWEDQEGNRDWVLAQAKLVAAGDVNALADERVSVFYLSEPLMLRWDSNEIRNNQDIVELPTGASSLLGAVRREWRNVANAVQIVRDGALGMALSN